MTSLEQPARTHNKSERQPFLLMLLLIGLVRGGLYIALTPPWQAPDENGHFEHAWLIAHLGRRPAAGEVSQAFENELMSSLYEWRYGEFIGRPLPQQMPEQFNELRVFAVGSRSAVGRFSLAYVWAALFIWPFRHQDLLVQLYAARLASLVLNLGIIWMIWRIFQTLLPGQPKTAAAMTAFVVFLPQHTFINASVSDGPLAELCACIVLYGWSRLLLRPDHGHHVITVLVGTFLGAWAKRTTAFLIPLNIVMVVVLWGAALFHRQRKQYLYIGIAALAVLGLLGGIWSTPAGRFVRIGVEQWWSTQEFIWENERVSLDQAVRYTFESFWAQFGWMSVRAGYGWYIIIYILMAFAIEGWVWPRSRPWSVQRRVLWLMGTALMLAWGGWLVFTVTTPTGLAYYQGRYLFTATVPMAFFVVGGWARGMPPSWQRYFSPLVLTLLAILDAAALCLSFLPYFYGR
ncbi:MAG: hypothetical protein ACPLYD_12900 [Anaerolineae bacterium]